MYNKENDIRLINVLLNSIKSDTTAYCDLFKTVLENFLKENRLDGNVLRHGKDIGMLDISETTHVVTVDNKNIIIEIPYCVTFRPYKKDGTLSNTHRIDRDIDTSSPTAYLASLLKIYTPTE